MYTLLYIIYNNLSPKKILLWFKFTSSTLQPFDSRHFVFKRHKSIQFMSTKKKKLVKQENYTNVMSLDFNLKCKMTTIKRTNRQKNMRGLKNDFQQKKKFLPIHS